MTDHPATDDIIGIGFGPANLSLAIALRDAMGDGPPRPSLRFIERQERFGWHRAMMLPGADMQISFVKDLVSLRDPTSPFSFLNYVLGLTGVRLRDYALASFGMLPMTLLYVYYGKLARDVAATASGAAETGPAELALQATGLAATIAVTVAITRLARRALNEATEQAPPINEDTVR